MDFRSNENFVLPEKYDDIVDENDNYKYVDETNIQQPSDLTPIDLDMDKKLCKTIRIKSEPENHNAHKRQTTLSEFFPVVPTETTAVKLERDDSLDKMVNVPLLLNQLFSARVVLNRLPEKIVKFETSICQTGVQRYCYKCKTLNVEYTNVSAQKICSDCGITLLYVCDKCNEKHYHIYNSFMRHKNRCKGDKTGKSLADVTLMHCPECTFKTTFQYIMEYHVKKSNHKVLDSMKIQKQQKELQLHVDPSKFIVKRNDIDFSYARKRYCPSCVKIVAGSSAKDDDTCDICNTILLYQCGKCNQICVSTKSLRYHLKTKCYPSIYRCPDCKFTAPIWERMRNHLKRRCSSLTFACHLKSDKSPCKKLQSFKKPHRDVKKEFMCELCSFTYGYERNLKRHIQRSHKK